MGCLDERTRVMWLYQQSSILVICKRICSFYKFSLKYIMPKKTCIPGLFCIENMTFFLMLLLLIVLTYLYYTNIAKQGLEKTPLGYQRQYEEKIVQPVVIMPPQVTHLPPALETVSSNRPLTNDYAPPLKNIEFEAPQYGLPVNIKSRGYEGNYSQVGILTRNNGKEEILPLMGRKSSSGRDKYQYYTMTNSAGNINTKLPISVNGKSCTSEIGCDQIHNGDTVFVEGYKDVFQATVYENSLFRYIPYV